MNKIKKLIKHSISKLFFRYCFQESKLADFLIVYYVPNTMRKLDGTKIDGQFLFAQIEEKLNQSIKYHSFLDVPVPTLKNKFDLQDWTMLYIEEK